MFIEVQFLDVLLTLRSQTINPTHGGIARGTPDKSFCGKTTYSTPTTSVSSIDYLKSKYDLWEEKEKGIWEPLSDNESDIPTEITEAIGPLDKLKDLTCSWWLLP
ncbi:hypothetical protein N8654_04750, partial [Synechococcus sp. AH-601-B19]|nr:hypothetical protein [Synechococcus sp. AH-601-B19]